MAAPAAPKPTASRNSGAVSGAVIASDEATPIIICVFPSNVPSSLIVYRNPELFSSFVL